MKNWRERTFYWQFVLSLRNIKATFQLKFIISAKLLLLIYKWIFENFYYRFDRLSKTLLFYFSFFDFDGFLTAFAKYLMKRPPVFMIDIKSSYKLLLSRKDLRSRNFWQWNDGPLNIFKNLYRNAFSLFVFIKRKNHCNVPFNDTYKMCCFHLF